MTRGARSYTDAYAELFQLLGNTDRLAIYGCLHQQQDASITELCDMMGWESEDGSADVQAMRRHLKALYQRRIVDRFDVDDNRWLSVESTLKDYLQGAIDVLCK